MKKEKHWLNKSNMAASLGISTQAFTAWGVEPVARIGREAFYTVADVLTNREAYYTAQEGADTDSCAEDRKIAYQLARIRLTNEQADAQQLKNEVTRQEVAPFAFITFVLGKAANEIAGVMDALPLEVTRKFNLSLQSVEKVREITSLASSAIANIADEDWLRDGLTEFNRERV